jgi:hypothetical protein
VRVNIPRVTQNWPFLNHAAFHVGFCHFACDFAPARSSRMAPDRHEGYAPGTARDHVRSAPTASTINRVEFAGSETDQEREPKVIRMNDHDLAVDAVAPIFRDRSLSRTKIARRLRRTHEDSEECRLAARAFFATVVRYSNEAVQRQPWPPAPAGLTLVDTNSLCTSPRWESRVNRLTAGQVMVALTVLEFKRLVRRMSLHPFARA